MSGRPTSAWEHQRLEHPLRRFRLPAAMLLTVLVYGTGGYIAIEGCPPLDALFMTVTTITTVGYREVCPLSNAGELFTISVITGGVATVLFTIGIFGDLLGSGQIEYYGRQRRMSRRIDDLSNHFIICGYGRIGTQIAAELDRARAPHVVIDINPEALGRLEREGRLHLAGDAASEDVLLAAGITRARGLFAAVDSDERCVYITLAARSLNPSLGIFSRAGQPESIRRLELAGADRVVSPYRMAGHQLTELALRPALIEAMGTIRHGGSEIGIEEFRVTDRSRARGKRLREAGLQHDGAARLLALRRQDGALYVDPGGELVLETGDLIVALGTTEELARTAEALE